MNDFSMRTLLYILLFTNLFLFSCAPVSRVQKDHTKNHASRSSTYKKKTPHHKNTPTKKYPYASKSSSTRNNIVHVAYSLKGTPYVYGGKNTKGFDCSGFTSYIFQSNNIQVSGNSNTQAKLGKKVSLSQAQKGDLIFFGNHNKISHVGIIAENSPTELTIIHCTSSRGVVKENIKGSAYWTPKILYARDIISTVDVAD